MEYHNELGLRRLEHDSYPSMLSPEICAFITITLLCWVRLYLSCFPCILRLNVSRSVNAMVSSSLLTYVIFTLAIIVLLTIDLGLFQRKSHEVSIKEALAWSAVWISLAILFNIGLFYLRGKEPALQFLTGYLIELSLSVDNLFVFLLIFMYFKVPAAYQHKVLFWGILGAQLMRGTLIGFGVVLISQFSWVLYLFGLFLVFTGIKMGIQDEEAEVRPERNIFVCFFKKVMPVTPGYHGSRFLVNVEGRHYATLLLIVVIVLETTDLLFALDSIPAVFAISTDPFIIYTSNICAILGLRSLYFALAGMMNLFHHLKIGLAIVLTFVGLKMLLAEIVPIPIGIALGVIGVVLFLSVIASLLWPKKEDG